MSFEGALESLPIPDLIQLLHSTGRSGTLSLKGPKGESQLVFDAGYIVSANHVNNSFRIGRILLDMGALTKGELAQALEEQALAGNNRTPLLASLLEAGKIQPQQAYKGLEILIQLTIVDVLTWSTGTFSLDTSKTFVSDEYRYFPENLKQKIQLNTQSVLMDALRIYDERKRDGTLMDAEFFGAEPTEEPLLSAEDLGLGDLDDLETVLPSPFGGIHEVEPVDKPRQRLTGALSRLTPADQEHLLRYLEALPQQAAAGNSPLLLLSDEPLLRELIATAFGPALRWPVSSEKDLDEEMKTAESERKKPVVLVAPSVQGDAAEALLRRICGKYPALQVYLLACPDECRQMPRALQTGISGVWPRPQRHEEAEGFAAEAIECLEALRAQLQHLCGREGQTLSPQFLDFYQQIGEVTTPPEVTLRLLQFVGDFFSRAVNFVQLRGELVAEKGIGFEGPGTVTPVRLRIPLSDASLLKETVEHGNVFYGEADDLMRSILPQPAEAGDGKVLLLPVKSLGRVIAVVYGDCPAGSLTPPLELMGILAQHAGLVIDNALYRKKNSGR